MDTDGKRHSWLPGWHMCLVMCWNTRKAQSKTLLCIAKQKHYLSVQMWGGKVGLGRGFSASCQHSRLWSTHLDKSPLSAEGWNMRLCCGSEVQINVRRELLAWHFEGRDGHVWLLVVESEWCWLLFPICPLTDLGGQRWWKFGVESLFVCVCLRMRGSNFSCLGLVVPRSAWF